MSTQRAMLLASALVIAVAANEWLLATPSRAASISIPSLRALVQSADTIVEGTVVALYPSPSFWLTPILVAVVVGFAALLLLKEYKKGWRKALTTFLVFVVAVILMAVLLFPASPTAPYPFVAVVAVSQTMKGPSQVDRVMFHCGYSISKGESYILFLRQPENSEVPRLFFPFDKPNLVLSWRTWAAWRITAQTASLHRFEQYKLPPVNLPKFKQAIEALVANPDDPEFARKTEREKGDWDYSLIIEDPLFNPRARKKLEEKEHAEEADSVESDAE